MLMMELLAIMWKQLTHNTALAFIAVLLISGSNSYVAYESSRTNINLEAITDTMKTNTTKMVSIAERGEENSKVIADTQRRMVDFQEKIFKKDWEQDKIIAEMYRNVNINAHEAEKLRNKIK